MKLRSFLCGGVAAAIIGLAQPASAVVIDGHLGLSGHVIYDTLDTSGHAGLDFFSLHTPPPGSTNPTGTIVEVDAVTSGSYMASIGITPFVTQAQILNITNDPTATGIGYTYAPDGTTASPFPIVNFLSSFTGVAGLHFDMTEFPDVVPLNTCPASPSCNEGPFVLQGFTDSQGNPGVTITFKVIGQFIRGADVGDYTGSFTVTINNLTLAEAGTRLTSTGADILCGPGNLSDACGFTANFDPTPLSAVPEPATMSLFGLGSLALAASRKRFAKKNKQ